MNDQLKNEATLIRGICERFTRNAAIFDFLREARLKTLIVPFLHFYILRCDLVGVKCRIVARREEISIGQKLAP